MRALVVDDSRAMRSLISGFLRDFGFEVMEACNGQEALTRLQENGKADLVLVDWNMPQMNGYEFICAVRADATYENTILVMVTAETDLSHVTQALDAGVSEYIMKPFTLEGLQEKLALLGLNPIAG